MVRCDDGSLAVVTTDDPTCPHEAWGEPILAFTWNSEHYAAVGNAGYGEDGVYLVRPGLVAWVTFTDEGIQDLTFRRVSRRNSFVRLALDFLNRKQAAREVFERLRSTSRKKQYERAIARRLLGVVDVSVAT